MADITYVPKFDYKEIETTTTELGRLYHTPRGDMSSLTTMLKFTKGVSGLDAWRKRVGDKVADQITNDAGIKGSTVHDLMEHHLRGTDVTELVENAPELVSQGYYSLRMYLKHITAVYGLEVPLYDPEFNIAGRSDVVGEWDSRPAIIDWKTSRRKKKAEWVVDYKLQLLYYAIAHNKMFGTDIMYGVILIAVENDMPQKFCVDFIKEDWLWGELATRLELFNSLGAHERLIDHIKTENIKKDE